MFLKVYGLSEGRVNLYYKLGRICTIICGTG